MYIMGISSYAHEASCALIKDGRIVSFIEEERLNREKHTWKYPKNAINRCLDMEGITLKDVDHISFFWAPLNEISGNISHFIKYFPDSLNLLKSPSGGGELFFSNRIRLMQNIGVDLKNQFGLERLPQIHFIEHHLAHAASAFFLSPYQESAILTMDGRGESASTLISYGRKNKIEKILEIKVPHSIGHLYAAITDYLSFRPFFDEWKVMGMSAYGKDTYVKDFEDVLHLLPGGRYELNLNYFKFHTHGQKCWLSDKFYKKFGDKQVVSKDYEQKQYDIAFALQKIVEKVGVHLAQYAYEVTKSSYLCMTGGVVLNCLMNKKIIEETHFKDYFFMPIANDAGASLGSAVYFNQQVLGQERKEVFSNIYLGPQFSDQEIEKVLNAKKINYKKSWDIAKDTAEHIFNGKIVGWFQGRMEAGPRALGNRSIVANPLDPAMKDRLNERVKKRENFRPFAPSVLEEKVSDYFIMPKDKLSPYMILIGDVREDKKRLIPAVTHVDGTARVHTVNRDVNYLYWQLIHEFEKLSGVPILLNTSFNENEPIVCTPEDAVNCFCRTEFDVLSIGNYLVVK